MEVIPIEIRWFSEPPASPQRRCHPASSLPTQIPIATDSDVLDAHRLRDVSK